MNKVSVCVKSISAMSVVELLLLNFLAAVTSEGFFSVELITQRTLLELFNP